MTDIKKCRLSDSPVQGITGKRADGGEGSGALSLQIEKRVAQSPFVFLGAGGSQLSTLGDFDLMTGRAKTPCRTTVSPFAKA